MKPTWFTPRILIASSRAAGVEFMDENGGAPAVRLQRGQLKKR